MEKPQIVQIAVLILSLSALTLGVLKAKENLIIPALTFAVLMSAFVATGRKGRTLKIWMCVTIAVVLAVNMASAFWTFERYSDAEWADFMLAAPSYTVASFLTVLSMVAHSDMRLDRLLLGVFTAFSTLVLSTAYTFVFALYRFPMPEADLLISNYFLNASSATMLIFTVAAVIMANRILRRKGINLLYPRHILDVAGAEGGE